MTTHQHLLFILFCVLLTGCATTRGSLDVRVPVLENPSSELAFRIPEVIDARRFEAKPPDPSIPSLKNSNEINDPKITSRAIARKRNSYGMAMGDILLPEGHTVSGVTSDAIVRAFRLAGYRVLDQGDLGCPMSHRSGHSLPFFCRFHLSLAPITIDAGVRPRVR
jgi:hypothetical protein